MQNESISDIIFDIVHSYRLAMRSELHANQLGLNAMHVKCISFISSTNSCTANDIVNHLSRDKAQIARLIKEMIDKQWLSKTANPNDKRSQLLSLTEQGQELALQIQQVRQRVHTKMQANLTAEELQAFEKVAHVINKNIRSEQK